MHNPATTVKYFKRLLKLWQGYSVLRMTLLDVQLLGSFAGSCMSTCITLPHCSVFQQALRILYFDVTKHYRFKYFSKKVAISLRASLDSGVPYATR